MKTDWLHPALLGTVILAVVLLLGSFMTEEAPPLRTPHTEIASAERQVPEETQAVPDPLYRLGIREGRVAILDGTGGKTLRVTEMPASSLPDPDRLALTQEIPVYSEEDLAHLLEDYGS